MGHVYKSKLAVAEERCDRKRLKTYSGKSRKIKVSNLSRIWHLQKRIYTKTNLHENLSC